MKNKYSSALTCLALATSPAHAATFLTNSAYDAPAFEYEAGVFEGEIHDETNDIALDPADHIVQINQLSTTTFQSNSYYWLPSDETDATNNGVPYIGIGLEELNPADWTSSEIIITFQALAYTGTGVGNYVLWSDTIDGTLLHFDSSDGAGDDLNTLAGSHIHYNWGFSDIGTYEITFGISGNHIVDGDVSGSATYTFQVVPEPSSALLAGIGALALLRRKR